MASRQSTTLTLLPFQFHNTTVSTITDDAGDPWFVARDACEALGITNVSQALARLDADEKNTICLNDGNRGNPDTLIISESGLYRLAMSSRKKVGKEFQRWIAHEVVPQIRKTGKYEAPAAKIAIEPTQGEVALALAQAMVSIEHQQRALAQAHQQEVIARQALETRVEAIEGQQPPKDKLTVIDWLRLHHKPKLYEPLLGYVKKRCAEMEEPELWVAPRMTQAWRYFSPYTIAAAYEDVTRQLSFFSREPAGVYRR